MSPESENARRNRHRGALLQRSHSARRWPRSASFSTRLADVSLLLGRRWQHGQHAARARAAAFTASAAGRRAGLGRERRQGRGGATGREACAAPLAGTWSAIGTPTWRRRSSRSTDFAPCSRERPELELVMGSRVALWAGRFAAVGSGTCSAGRSPPPRRWCWDCRVRHAMWSEAVSRHARERRRCSIDRFVRGGFSTWNCWRA